MQSASRSGTSQQLRSSTAFAIRSITRGDGVVDPSTSLMQDSLVQPDLFAPDPDGMAGLKLNDVGHLFPIKSKRCYLNNASIGAVSDPVFNAVNRFMANVRDNGRNDYPKWCVHADTTMK